MQAQQETQKAALSYERAVSMHTAAREMVYVAEQGLMADGKNTLDPTWQEMLNHATSKVTVAPGMSAALYLSAVCVCVCGEKENESFTGDCSYTLRQDDTGSVHYIETESVHEQVSSSCENIFFINYRIIIQVFSQQLLRPYNSVIL